MLIGEVSAQSGISVRMLRHYDAIGLVRPTARTSGGYRRYADADVRRLFQVEGLRSLGLGLPEVARVLDDLAFDPAPLVEQLVERTRARLAQEEELLRRLTLVRAGGPTAWTDVLRTVALLRGLRDDDPSARQRLVLGLAGAAGDDAAALTQAALDEPDTNVAGALQWALARTGDTAVPDLAEALGSPDADRRRRAVATLEKIGSPQALAVLADAAGHADPFVHGRATLARGARGDTGAVTALVAMVAAGREDVAAADALAALATHHGCAGAVAHEVDAALAHSPGAARRRLTAALAEVPGREAQRVLTALVDDADRGVALTATALLRTRPGTTG